MTYTLSEETLFDNVPKGTVYTPEAIAKHLVYMGLIAFLKRQHKDYSKTLYVFFFDDSVEIDANDELKALFQTLMACKVSDICSGSGNLLLTYVHFYLKMGRALHIPTSQLEHDLSHNIYAMDIDPIAIDAYKSQMLQLCEHHGLSPHLIFLKTATLDVLLEPCPYPDASFDIILGNPPYIGEKGNTALFSKVKQSLWGKDLYEGKMDYFYFFVYKSMALVKPQGVVSLLTSNYFVTADGASKLRAFFKHKAYITQWLNYEAYKVFGKKSLHACIYTLSHEKPTHTILYDVDLKPITQIPYDDIFKHGDTMHFIYEDTLRHLIRQFEKNTYFYLDMHYSVNQGIVTGMDRSGEEPVFVLKSEEALKAPEGLRPYLKPFFKNSDILHYIHKEKSQYSCLYVSDTHAINEALTTWLMPYKNALEKRREVISGARQWYMLTWPRNIAIFEGEKIIVPQRSQSNVFAYSNEPFYSSADIYYITARHTAPYSLKTICLILNDNLYFKWLSVMGKRKGDMLELYATPLKKLPIPYLTPEHIVKLDSLAFPPGTKEQGTVTEILKEAFDL